MSRPPRVLLVDEDPDVIEVSREFLQRADPDLEVETVTNAGDALALVREGAVDVVVTDYRMPGMDGVELAREVECPCLLYTAAEPSNVAGALDGPVARHVRKRTGAEQYEELAAAIREVA